VLIENIIEPWNTLPGHSVKERRTAWITHTDRISKAIESMVCEPAINRWGDGVARWQKIPFRPVIPLWPFKPNFKWNLASTQLYIRLRCSVRVLGFGKRMIEALGAPKSSLDQSLTTNTQNRENLCRQFLQVIPSHAEALLYGG
jgi:hypothetical protein